jgi:hypothetical protein
MIIRLSKALLVCAIALFATLVAFGNITDYGSNFAFVRHVFMMDTIFPDATITYRSIQSPWLHHAGYIGIIFLESLTALLCWVGGVRLLCGLKLPAVAFNRKKKTGGGGSDARFSDLAGGVYVGGGRMVRHVDVETMERSAGRLSVLCHHYSGADLPGATRWGVRRVTDMSAGAQQVAPSDKAGGYSRLPVNTAAV